MRTENKRIKNPCPLLLAFLLSKFRECSVYQGQMRNMGFVGYGQKHVDKLLNVNVFGIHYTSFVTCRSCIKNLRDLSLLEHKCASIKTTNWNVAKN